MLSIEPLVQYLQRPVGIIKHVYGMEQIVLLAGPGELGQAIGCKGSQARGNPRVLLGQLRCNE